MYMYIGVCRDPLASFTPLSLALSMHVCLSCCPRSSSHTLSVCDCICMHTCELCPSCFDSLSCLSFSLSSCSPNLPHSYPAHMYVVIENVYRIDECRNLFASRASVSPPSYVYIGTDSTRTTPNTPSQQESHEFLGKEAQKRVSRPRLQAQRGTDSRIRDQPQMNV